MPNYETTYVELCKSYHRLKDFRAKLLGFLPLTSGAAIFLLIGSGHGFQLVLIGLFGIGVTIGLYVYERHGTELLCYLFKAGKELEKKLLDYENDDSTIGQFLVRPEDGLGSNKGAEDAAKIVYGSVAIAWIVLAIVGFINFLQGYSKF